MQQQQQQAGAGAGTGTGGVPHDPPAPSSALPRDGGGAPHPSSTSASAAAAAAQQAKAGGKPAGGERNPVRDVLVRLQAELLRQPMKPAQVRDRVNEFSNLIDELQIKTMVHGGSSKGEDAAALPGNTNAVPAPGLVAARKKNLLVRRIEDNEERVRKLLHRVREEAKQ